MTLRQAQLERVRAKLAVLDRPRSELLLRTSEGTVVVGLARELNRPLTERAPFLATSALSRILDALDESDESILRVAHLVEWLRWIPNHRDLMEQTDPRKAIANRRMVEAGRRRVLENFAAARDQLDPGYHAEIGALIERVKGEVRPIWRTNERWATGHNPELLGQRGKVTKTDKIGRWRGLLVRELAALVPANTFNRYAAIAELLTAAGVKTTPQYVRSVV